MDTSAWIGFWSTVSTVLFLGLVVLVIYWTFAKKRKSIYKDASSTPLESENFLEESDGKIIRKNNGN